MFLESFYGQSNESCKIIFLLCVTNISLYQSILVNTLQKATGGTGLLSHEATAVNCGCSVHALDPSLVNSYMLEG